MDNLPNSNVSQHDIPHSPTSLTGLTELGNARQFVARHGNIIRYVPSWGWLTWDGKRWHIDELDIITSLAKETILSFSDDVTSLPDTQQRQYKNLLEHARRSSVSPRIQAMITLASTDQTITATPFSFDTDPFLLTVQNGTINLRTGELQPHHPQDFITHLAPVIYHPDLSSPFWDTFLAEITNHDPALQQYLQRAVGYSLTASTKEETLFLLYGLGRNGKSRFLSAISTVLGGYAQCASSSIFMRAPHGARPATIPTSLSGTRLLTTTETEPDQLLELSIIKHLTSGEPIVTHRPYHESGTFHPQCKLWIATNHLPTISESNVAIWQRIKLIPFSACFVGHEDKDLAEKLHIAAPAILSWAVQGCSLWQQSGLQEPACVQQATATYQQEQDELADFLQLCCLKGNDQHVRASELYEAYQLWCHYAHEPSLPQRSFVNNILAHGYQRERKKTGKIYQGIGLLTPLPLLSQALEQLHTSTAKNHHPTPLMNSKGV